MNQLDAEIALGEAAKPRNRSLLAEGVEPIRTDCQGVAELLGCSASFVRDMNDRGKLPAPSRLGGRVLWDVPELRAWSAAGCPERAAWEKLKNLAKK